MRLGAPLLESYESPEEWVRLAHAKGYRAVYSPVSVGDEDAEIDKYAQAAGKAGLIIGEQGAWRCNCLSDDNSEREAALEYCASSLAVADRIGARCCVSLSGSKGERWAAPHKENLSEDAFALVVENVRKVIDLVKPQRAYYTLEAMPWTVPCSTETYERLIKAVDREMFGVHYDPVNLVYSPSRYYHSGRYIQDFLKRLGGKVRSCHVKDVKLLDQYVFHLEECIPGEGGLDYSTLLRELGGLEPDLPIMMEHLTEQSQYDQGAAFIREKAVELRLQV